MLGISGQQEPRSAGLKRAVERARSRMSMDTDAVKSAYKRWAPVYDHTFGRVASEGRKHAVEVINTRKGRVLEVGVGTGLSLPDYARHLEIVGVDLSPEMLEKAHERVATENLTNVTGLYEMDASEMDFPDASFDTVAAMFVMTVVPDPEKVMRELNRLTKPGGEVLLVNHFSQEEGVRGWVERRMAPFADKIGWKPLFDIDHVMVCDELKLVERRALRPIGLFTMLRFSKQAESNQTQRRAA
jgi:phosphatidylethanolamine/phosphatidyl-N-methylethanolamine N-methyltransferase